MKVMTRYFDTASSGRTSEVLQLVREFLDVNPDVRFVVVATTEGTTGLAAAQQFVDRKVMVVSHQAGFAAPNTNELADEIRKRIESFGARVLTTTHAFAGISRGIRKAFNTWTTPELLAAAYRTFGQGTKVCAEIAMMAADAGLVPVSENIVCIAGTGRGADTAWVIRPAYTSSFTELRLRACICKPIDF